MESDKELLTKKATSTSKKDAFDILDGEVKLYRTTSKVWQFQMWISDEQKYVRESLRTEDKDAAIAAAKRRYVAVQSKVDSGEKIFSISAGELRERFVQHCTEKQNQNQISEGRLRNIRTYTKHYIEFVGTSTKIRNIEQKKFREYLGFRRQKKSDILATVVANESVTIKQMYRFAADEGLISPTYKCDFGIIKRPAGESVRESYTIKEYGNLVQISKGWHKKNDVKSEEERYYRRLINDFVLIMANGGFRTQEARLLKWKDIKKIYAGSANSETYAEVVVRAENSKVRKTRRFEMRRGDVFERIKSYSSFTEPDDYVFSMVDKKDVITKTILYDIFGELIKQVKGKYSEFDSNKSLYCLRHLWITIRIMAGLNVYDIAKIAGTSLTQIQKHYDAVTSLVTSKQMNKSSIRFDSQGNIVLETDT